MWGNILHNNRFKISYLHYRKMTSIHYEPLNFPPSEFSDYTACKGMANIPVFISKFAESPFKGLGLKHGLEKL